MTDIYGNPANSASNIFYDNDTTGLLSDNVQGAIDELANDPLASLPPSYSKQFSTGVVTGGVLALVGAPDASQEFSITDGEGMIVNNTTGDIAIVTWSGLTNEDFGPYTNILSFVFIQANGTVRIQLTTPTNDDIRDEIFLGVLISIGTTNLTTVNNAQMDIAQVGNQLRDVSEAIGFLNVAGNVLSPVVGGLLKIQKSAGELFKFGSNYLNDPKNPHILIIPLIDTSISGTFQYRFQDGTGGPLTETDIDPNLKDTGTFPGGTYTNQRWGASRVYIFTSGALKI